MGVRIGPDHGSAEVDPAGRVTRSGRSFPGSRLMLHLSDLTPGDQDRLRTDLRIALSGGLVAALVMGTIVFVVGTVNSGQARSLLQGTLPTTRFLASSVMTVSSTTLALMLTLLSLSTGLDREIKSSHFERIRQIAFVDVIAFVAATLLLVMIVVPLNESSQIPSGWYVGIYYAVTLVAAALGGILVAVMLLLYAALRDLITTVSGEEDSPLVADEDEAEDHETDSETREQEAEAYRP